jgi:tetrahydromethanopterin S-methyltransferase subunit F
MITNSSALIAVIESAGFPALRVGFTFAVIVFLLAGVCIFRRRHQLFDRDPNVENDVPAVRHNRGEEVVFVWSGLMLVLLSILFQVWSA